MHRTAFFIATLLLFAAALPAADTPELSRLAGRRFALESVDGETFHAARQPFIEFTGEGMMTGRICNTFRGKAGIKDGTLTVSGPVATLMLCPDEKVTRLEHRLFALFPKGMAISLEEDRLELRGDGAAFVFKAEAQQHSATAECLRGRKFELASVDGAEYAGDPRPNIEFDANLAVHGKVCNGFRGQGTLENGVLRTAQVVSTRMLCVHNDLSQLETRLLRLLDAGVAVDCDDGTLTLRADGTALVFRAVSADDDLAASLAGRRFALKRVNGEAFSVAAQQPFIAFDADLRVSGSACNSFAGPGRVKDGVLYLENAASTMKLCIDPKLNEYERDFHKLLREGATVSLADGALTLKGEGVEFVYGEE